MPSPPADTVQGSNEGQSNHIQVQRPPWWEEPQLDKVVVFLTHTHARARTHTHAHTHTHTHSPSSLLCMMVTLKNAARKQRSKGRGEKRSLPPRRLGLLPGEPVSFHLPNRTRGRSQVSNLTPLAQQLDLMDCFLLLKL